MAPQPRNPATGRPTPSRSERPAAEGAQGGGTGTDPSGESQARPWDWAAGLAVSPPCLGETEAEDGS